MAFEGRIGHLTEIESPWGNAGGVAKTIEDVQQLAHTGVGWIEAGSYTLEPRVGNSPDGEKVYDHNPETGLTHNSLGMPNKGFDVVETQIPEMLNIAHSLGKQLIINVAPVTEDPLNESIELVSRAYEAGADAVLLNAGCPNVRNADGSSHEILSHNITCLKTVLGGLKKTTQKYAQPIMLRLSPFETNGHKRLQAAQAVWLSGVVSALFTPNTWPTSNPTSSEGGLLLDDSIKQCGRSGPATADAASEETQLLTSYLTKSSIDVIASGGIINARELQRRLDLGAVAGAGTTFFYESESWAEDTNRLLSEMAG